MSAQPITVIACDIGGVIKDHRTDEPVENAIESIIQLSQDPSNRLIFISKCKDNFKNKSNEWLKKHNLSHIDTYYCIEYGEKVQIAHDHHVNIMIDDRMNVLSTFPPSIIKIWFCSDMKKIEGAKKFQPDFVDSVRLARNWHEVIELVEQIQLDSTLNYTKLKVKIY
ncbi:unnamed protein product [Adineta steineri]|uniref:Uncharacterized protein n=2 Tax=Adineta steineri TaxID=433720 RepID=A0A819QCC1_9BILA|nr:unnamed protein product [Adineta steineri]